MSSWVILYRIWVILSSLAKNTSKKSRITYKKVIFASKIKLIKMKQILLTLVFTIVSSVSAWALDFGFRHLNTSNGLPNQQVEAIVQDVDGYIWIGTRNGLAKFDGYNVQTYYHQEGHPHSLIHNFVHGLFVDSKKNLWIATENGVSRYRSMTDDFQNYSNVKGYCTSFVETKDGRILTGHDKLFVYDKKRDVFIVYPSLNYGAIASLAKDDKGNIYVSTNKAVFSFNATLSKISLHKLDDFGNSSIEQNTIKPLFVDSHQRLWIGCDNGGLTCITLATDKEQKYDAKLLTGGIVRTITEDKRHNIWLGTEMGIAVIAPDGHIERIKKEPNKSNSLTDNAIYSILSDREDNIWIGSYFGGVDYLVKRNSWFMHDYANGKPGAFNARIPRSIVEAEGGLVWIATEDNGVFIYDMQNHVFTPFTGIPTLGSNVHSLYYDPVSRDMWIGSRFNGLFRYQLGTHQYSQYYYTNGITSAGIFDVCKTSNGRIWVATMDGLRYYDAKNNVFRKIGHQLLDHVFIYSLFEDSKHRLWAATTSYGLFCIDHGKVIRYSKESHCGLTDNYIIVVFEDSQKQIWIGTNNSGMFCLDTTGKEKIKHASCGLPQECTICSIVEDANHCLWIGTDRGLFRYNIVDGSTRCFTANAELPVNQFNFTSSYYSPRGFMMMGTFDGLLTFHPQKIEDKPVNYQIHFKQLYINNKLMGVASEDSPLKTRLDCTDEIVLSYDQAKSFSIEYGVIMPGCMENVRYQIKVDGIDKDWRDMGTEHRFNGYLLQPGNYRLHVRAYNGVMNEGNAKERVLNIVVKAPFYRSNFAIFIYFLLLCGIAFGAIAFYNMRMKEKAEIKYVSLEKEKVKEVDKMKSNFFTMVSHELKTPLALIKAPLKTIAASQLNEDAKTSLDMAIRNATKMEHMINELVTFNKIESDNFPFYVQQGNPVEFIAMAAANFKEVVSSKGLKLEMRTIDNGEDGWFSPSYIEHILNNLMSNAMKFTSTGGVITIGAEMVRKPESSDLFLKMEVADTGIGIMKEEIANIFERYYQTKRGFNANSKGWGIGLSLVRRLAEIHKGSVAVDSELGKGSTFTVLIDVAENAFSEKDKISSDKELVTVKDYVSKAEPLAVDSQESGMLQVPMEVENAEDKHTLLVVEDNVDMLRFLTELLGKTYHVVTAEDGQEAWNIAISRQDIEMVVSDVMMPKMTGNELCNMLKGNMATSHIPVILLTAKSDPDDIKSGYKDGADVYISKPFDPMALCYQIGNILRLVCSRQEKIVEGGKEAAEANKTLTQLDKDFVKNICDMVEANLDNANFSIEDITVSMGISRSLLYTKMKSLMNISMGDYIRHKRIERACRMLSEGYNVSETAYACGFSDPNYFSKVFKKIKGVAPSDYS